MTLVELLVTIFQALRPIVIIFDYQRGVRWTFGRNPRTLGPGVHFKVWPVQEIEILDVKEDFIKFPVQSIITKDGKCVCFSAVISFIVEDPVKHFCEVVDFPDAIEAISMIHLAKRVRAQEYDELTAEGGLTNLEGSLRGTLTTQVKDWGAKIVNVGFENFCEVPIQARLFGIKEE